MKLNIHQDLNCPETEITVNCSHIDKRLQQLIDRIRQFCFSLTCYEGDREYQLPIEEVYFIDSTDGKTFLYPEKGVFQCRETLSRLEEMLRSSSFVRISKNCLVNTAYLASVSPLYNHRLEAHMINGEKLIVTRNYIEALRARLAEGK